MQITLNGQKLSITENLSVASLVDQRELNPKQIAIEINCQIVPREEYDQVLLADGDSVELVTLAGGG